MYRERGIEMEIEINVEESKAQKYGLQFYITRVCTRVVLVVKTITTSVITPSPVFRSFYCGS